VGRLQAGDHLLVSSGTYTGSVFIANLVGSPSLVTIIEAAPGAQVIIQGPGVDGGRVRIDGCHYLELKGFEVTNFNQGVFVQGASSNITLSDLEVHFVGQEGMHVKENSWDVLIYSCFIYDTDQWLYNGEGIYIGTGSGGPLDNTHHVTVRGCVIHDTVDEAVELKPGTHDCLVEGNLVFNVTTASSFGAIEVNQHVNGVQTWSQDPAHVVRDNVVHDTDTAIRAGTGCLVYNNVVWDVSAGSYGILVDNIAGDSFQRRIYHNTVSLPSASALHHTAGDADIRNNIGPSTADNLTAEAGFFVSTTAGSEDFHLVEGTLPVDAGVWLTGVVDIDIEGLPRPLGAAPDCGAYEYDPLQLIFVDRFEGGDTGAWSTTVP